jgi:hypothetical protein
MEALPHHMILANLTAGRFPNARYSISGETLRAARPSHIDLMTSVTTGWRGETGQ